MNQIRIPAEELRIGDMIDMLPPTVVLGEPIIGPIPTFTTDDAVVVPIRKKWRGATAPVTTSQCFRVGQIVTVDRPDHLSEIPEELLDITT